MLSRWCVRTRDSLQNIMPIIELSTQILGPIDLVFDLSRSIDLHIESTSQTSEKAVAGCTSGLISLGQEVTWEATHFGVRQQLTTKIVAFNPPYYFRDSMVTGIFTRFDHDHFFEANGQSTVMKDRFDFTSPFGILGRLANTLFLERYIRKFLRKRNQIIKSVAESSKAIDFVTSRVNSK